MQLFRVAECNLYCTNRNLTINFLYTPLANSSSSSCVLDDEAADVRDDELGDFELVS